MSIREETPRQPPLFFICSASEQRFTRSKSGPGFGESHAMRRVNVFGWRVRYAGKHRWKEDVMYSVPACLLPLTLKTVNGWWRQTLQTNCWELRLQSFPRTSRGVSCFPLARVSSSFSVIDGDGEVWEGGERSRMFVCEGGEV